MNLAPCLRPRISFMPVIINALSSQTPDAAAKQFQAQLGARLTKQLLDNWSRLSGQEKTNRYYLSRDWRAPSGNFATQMAVLSKSWQAAKEQLILERKKVIKAEIDRALGEGVGHYAPSPVVAKDKTLAYEVAKKLQMKLIGCRCGQPGSSNPPPPQPYKKFGAKISKIKCYDQREAGHDEIYLVSTVVDGNGNLITTTSAKYSIDDENNDVVYPNYWIYPIQDPKGFLDVAIQMWEDDGGYGQAGQTVAAIGGALSKIPNPYTVVAGVALTIIGEIISLSSWLDDDDHYGDAFKTWPSTSNLEGGVGSYILSYYEVDKGLFDDGHDFDVTMNLLSA